MPSILALGVPATGRRARAALLLGLGASLLACATTPGASSDFARLLAVTAGPPLREQAALDPAEEEAARVAWRYFENNRQPTGLVNAVDRYPSTTLWDLASYAMGLLAARDLGIVDEATFDDWLGTFLASLTALPLVDGLLPNKAYDTRTLHMVDYGNNEAPAGIGWSALDIARLSVPLVVASWRHPRHAEAVRALVAAWRLEQLVANGRMQGGMRDKDGQLLRVQEGRLGYEQYGARALQLLGLEVGDAARYDLEAQVAVVSGQAIPYDRRLPRYHAGTHNAVLSEPYFLAGIEFGFDETTLPLARAVYTAQENRAHEVGRLVAVSEDNLDRPPYFAYNSLLNDERPWVAFAPDGQDASAHKSLSLKAAFAWSYLFADEYSDQLRRAALELRTPDRGFLSGRYDADGSPNKAITANANGVVLEVLWYHARGPLLPAATR